MEMTEIALALQEFKQHTIDLIRFFLMGKVSGICDNFFPQSFGEVLFYARTEFDSDAAVFGPVEV